MCVIRHPCSFRWRELHLERIVTLIQPRRTRKALCRSGGSDKLQHRFVAHQRLASPVGTDQTKHAMLDRVPLRRTRREVRHRDCQIEFVRQSLQPGLPAPASVTIGTTAIGLDQQLCGSWILPLSLSQPPATKRRNGELRRFMRRADHNISAIVPEVVNPVRYRFADGLAGEVMVPHVQHCSPPCAPGILEAPNQLLLLRIDANDWVARLCEGSSLLSNIPKLAITIRILGAGD